MARPFAFAAVAALALAMAACALAGPADASVFAADSTGAAVGTFYTNGTVYAAADANITNESRAVRLYVTADNNSWADGAVLTDVHGGYNVTSTNASGHMPLTQLWSRPAAGYYDIVADVNADGYYNSSTDFADSTSAAGFAVLQNPQPSLAVAPGAENPSDSNWPVGNASHVTVMQFTLTGGASQDVSVSSITFFASGTGDDAADVRVAYLVEDVNGDGAYNTGDAMLGYGTYSMNDGLIDLLSSAYTVPVNTARKMLLAYDMADGAYGSTYVATLAIVDANGAATNEPAQMSGIPLKSSTLTLGGAAAPSTTTTMTSVTSTTSGIMPNDECAADSDCPVESCTSLQMSRYACKVSPSNGLHICAATIESVQCCGNGDCGTDETCTGNLCAPTGLQLVWFGGNANYLMFGVIVVVVIGTAAAVFFIITNKQRGHTPWKTDVDYERDWRRLRDKWKK
jgi:hypothetical protein